MMYKLGQNTKILKIWMTWCKVFMRQKSLMRNKIEYGINFKRSRLGLGFWGFYLFLESTFDLDTISNFQISRLLEKMIIGFRLLFWSASNSASFDRFGFSKHLHFCFCLKNHDPIRNIKTRSWNLWWARSFSNGYYCKAHHEFLERVQIFLMGSSDYDFFTKTKMEVFRETESIKQCRIRSWSKQ